MSRTVCIAGGGELGLGTATLLHEHGHDVILVERDEGRCEELTDRYVGSVIEGDARRPAVLRQVDPDRCDSLAAMTGKTVTNAGICLTANRIADVETVMRVTDPGEIEEYEHVADRILYPEETAARTVTNALARAGVRSIERLPGELEILEIEVDPDAPAAGRRVADVGFPQGAIVIAAADGAGISTPDTVLEAGQRFVVAVEATAEQGVLELLRG